MLMLSPQRFGVKLGGADPLGAQLLCLLHMDGGITDETGKVWEKNVAALTSSGEGKFGQGIVCSLNDSSPYTYRTVNLETIGIGTGDFTMELWFKTPPTWPVDLWNRLLCSISAADVGAYIILRSRSVAAPRFEYFCGASGIASTVTLAADTWYHVAMVRISGVVYGYVDGVSQGSVASSFGLPSPERIYLGASGNGNWYNPYGTLDELRITRAARYTSGFSPPTEAFPNP